MASGRRWRQVMALLWHRRLLSSRESRDQATGTHAAPRLSQSIQIRNRGGLWHAHYIHRSRAMNKNRTLYRRGVLQIAAIFGAMGAFSPVKLALAQSARARTPDQI